MKFLKVARREYLERVKKKSFLVGTVLGPVLMGAMIIVPGMLFELTPESQVTMAVVDIESAIYNEFTESLQDTLDDGSSMFVFRHVRASEGEIDQVKRSLNAEIEADAIDGYLIIPGDIVSKGEAAYFGKRLGAVKTLERVERALDQAVIGKRLAGEGMDYSKVKNMIRGVKLKTMRVSKGEERKSDFEMIFITTFVFIMMLYMTILLWGVAVQRSIIEEKNNRVVEVLLSSLTSFDLMIGKILGVGAVGLTQYAIWSIFALLASFYALSTGTFAGAVSFTWVTLAYFALFYVLGFLFYASLFAGIGSVCNSDQEAQQLQTPVVMCLVFTILVPMAVIQNPDGTFATVVSLIPFFTPIVMFMRINVLMPPAWQIVLSVAILIMSIYVAGKLAAKIFHIGVLMYGKRPSVREIFKWLKRA